MSTMNYQPYLQAILLIAKHYRIETSEERIRLQMDWAGASAADEVVKTIARQIGLSVRKSKFSKEMLYQSSWYSRMVKLVWLIRQMSIIMSVSR